MKTLFLILFPFLLFGQTSNGFVLDNSFFIGHVPYIQCFDTIGQSNATNNVPECLKFSLQDSYNQIIQVGDTGFVLPYAGIYKVDMNFIYSKASGGGTADYLRIYIKKNRIPVNNSRIDYLCYDDTSINSINYTNNYNFTFNANTNDTLKIMYKSTDTHISINYNCNDTGSPFQPAINLKIQKISD